MTRLLLAGATGLIGSAVLEQLLADPRVSRIVAPTRRALTPHARLDNPITTIEALPHDADWWAVDGAICALGTTRAQTPSPDAYRVIDHDYPLTIATLVRQHDAKSFALVSSAGADAKSRFRYTRTKGELEEAIEHLGFPSLTIARPGFLGGRPKEDRAMEHAMATLLQLVGPILPASARINPAATLATLLIEAVRASVPGKRIVTSAEIARAADRAR